MNIYKSYTVFLIAIHVCLIFVSSAGTFAQSTDYEKIAQAVNNFISEVEKCFPDDKKNDSIFQGHSPSVSVVDIQSRIPLYDAGVVSIPLLLESYYKYRTKNPNVCSAVHDIYRTITEVNNLPEKNPWVDYDFGMEWYGGREQAKERFNLLHKILSTANELDDRKILRSAIISQGIYVLPFMIEEIRAGSECYKKIFEDMMAGGTEWPSKEHILSWWEKNKEKYRIPPQNAAKFRLVPATYLIDPNKEYSIAEKIEILYPIWKKRHILDENNHPLHREESERIIALAQLIGYENTPQFRFLVDLGEEALPHLFLKLKDEETRFTLPVIEKIMNRKLSDEEIEQRIKEAELLLNPPEPIAMRSWTSKGGNFGIEAKYIASDGKSVTLEKANGTTISVELSKLSEVVQEYVKSQEAATENATE